MPSWWWRLWAWLLGLALGARIGALAAGRPAGWFDWVVLTALLLGGALVLLGPGRGRPMTRRELEAAIQAYVAEHKRRFPGDG